MVISFIFFIDVEKTWFSRSLLNFKKCLQLPLKFSQHCKPVLFICWGQTGINMPHVFVLTFSNSHADSRYVYLSCYITFLIPILWMINILVTNIFYFKWPCIWGINEISKNSISIIPNVTVNIYSNLAEKGALPRITWKRA